VRIPRMNMQLRCHSTGCEPSRREGTALVLAQRTGIHAMSYRSRLVYALLAGCLCVCSPAWTQSWDSDSPLDIAYWREWDKLNRLTQTDDLQGLFDEADTIEKDWPDKNLKYYAKLVMELCIGLNTVNQADPAGQARIRAIAQRALEKRALGSDADFPLDAHLSLLGYVQPIREARLQRMRAAKDYGTRQREFEAWLEVLQRIERAHDPTWDPNTPMFRNISPPPGTGLPSGVAPEAIKDPELRAQYEADLRRMAELARRGKANQDLEYLRKRALRRIAEFVEYAYCRTREDFEELNSLLDEYLSDESMKSTLRCAPSPCP